MSWSVSMWWSSFIRYFVPKTASRAFSASTPVVSLSPAFERILQSFSVWMPSSSMLSRSSCARKRSSQILKMSYPTVSWRVVPANFKVILSTSARETFCTRKLLACPPARSMLKMRAREPELEDLVFIQLGHRNIQGLSRVCFAALKCYELNRALGLHSSECFFCLCRMQSFLHIHVY